jgi:hypothetical protein
MIYAVHDAMMPLLEDQLLVMCQPVGPDHSNAGCQQPVGQLRQGQYRSFAYHKVHYLSLPVQRISHPVPVRFSSDICPQLVHCKRQLILRNRWAGNSVANRGNSPHNRINLDFQYSGCPLYSYALTFQSTKYSSNLFLACCILIRRLLIFLAVFAVQLLSPGALPSCLLTFSFTMLTYNTTRYLDTRGARQMPLNNYDQAFIYSAFLYPHYKRPSKAVSRLAFNRIPVKSNIEYIA